MAGRSRTGLNNRDAIVSRNNIRKSRRPARPPAPGAAAFPMVPTTPANAIMRILLQRVERADVSVDEATVSFIGPGLCVFLGVGKGDSERDGAFLADKLLNLRIFPDESGKFNRSIMDTGGEILVVSQFTLYGDCRKGRRPSMTDAAAPEEAEWLYRDFVDKLSLPDGPGVRTGTFQANMKVALVNDGPVTFLIDSAEPRKKR